MSKKCKICQKDLPAKYVKFCSAECAKTNFGRKRHQRTCKCGKVEFVANTGQLAMDCRSCSKLGNTSSQNMSEESRRKISEAKKGSTPWNKGKANVYDEATRHAMGSGSRGRPRTDAEKEATSKTLKETYQREGSKLKGRELTEEHKGKIAQGLNDIKSERCDHTLETLLSHLDRQELNHAWPDEALDNPIGMLDFVELQCRCGTSFHAKVQNLIAMTNSSCPGCRGSKSYPETELYDFLTGDLQIPEEKVLTNRRPSFMEGLELDLYLPSYSLAIEYHGLAHHSERPVFGPKDLGKIKRLHEKKYLLAKAAGVRLIQIFEDEWAEKRPLVESMLRARLGVVEHRIYARNTEVVEIDPATAQAFFDENHISGQVSAKVFLGLAVKGIKGPVAILSLRKPWTRKYGKVLEIARFASLAHYQVVGGFSKLLKPAMAAVRDGGYEGLLTYADCRWGSGEVYDLTGFEHLGKTKPNYFYECDGVREARFKHRKKPNLPGDTEREQQNQLDWYAIYDAGSEIYYKEWEYT